jgi:hypothetical protein
MRHSARIMMAMLSMLASGTGDAAIELDATFWDNYVPYQQYTAVNLRDLVALREGDLLETGSEIDGLEIRVVGRSSSTADLVSARAVIDSIVRNRLQLKVLPFSLSPNDPPRLESQRRQLSAAQADELQELLEQLHFWEAPYSADTPDDAAENGDAPAAVHSAGVLTPGRCADPGHWIVEAVRPGEYELIARSGCAELDPIVAQIRDFLLGLAGVSLER